MTDPVAGAGAGPVVAAPPAPPADLAPDVFEHGQRALY